MENQLETNGVDQSHEMASHEDYEKSFKKIGRGDYLMGKVVKLEDNGVYVDVGYKQEGFIPLNQLSHRNIGNPADEVSVGDEIPIVVLKCNDLEGGLILSKKRADLETAWRTVTDAFAKGEEVTATVVEAVKGGLLVDLGLRGFVPASQVDLRPVKDLNDFVGEALKLKVIELDRSRRKVVLSRKKVMEDERSRMKEDTLSGLYEGQIVQGTIARLTNFGAFVNLGGVDGLVHISEISWKRIKVPSEVLKVGQEVDVMVLKVDKQKERISLSIRQALPDPWSVLDESVQVGSVIKGIVTKIAKKYIFVEVAEGVEGVIPMNEVSDKRNVRAEELVKEGQEIDIKVLELNKTARRMLLSLKQAAADTGTKEDVTRFTSAVTEKSSGEGASIGDILKAKMKEMQNGEKETPAPSAVEEPAPVRKETPAVKEPAVEKANPYAISASLDEKA